MPNGFFIGLMSIWFLWQIFKLLNLYIIPHQFKVKIAESKQMKSQGNHQVEILIHHKSLFPMFHAQLELICENQLTNKKDMIYLPVSFAGNEEQQLKVELQLDVCGLWEIQTVAVNQPKLISPSNVKFEATSNYELLVLPRIFNMNFQLENEGIREDESSASGSVVIQQGSERFGFRAYRKGDPMKSIHWKLSAKQDELVVSEQLEIEQVSRQFYIEKTANAVKYDTLLSLLFSMLYACEKANQLGHIRINQVDYTTENIDDIAYALLSGQSCDKPNRPDFIALVYDEAVSTSIIYRLKNEEIACLKDTDFTTASIEEKFVAVQL